MSAAHAAPPGDWPAALHAVGDRPSGVKAALTPRRWVENDEYARFVGRVVRSFGRRVARGDVEHLRTLAAVAEEVDRATRVAVAGLRDDGYSWSEIGARLGVTRQAAQQRYGKT